MRVGPHWRKAPAALFTRPPLLAAVSVASLLVALAAASSSLFTTAAGNAALKAKLAEITSFGAGLEIDNLDNVVTPSTPDDRLDLARKDRAVHRAVRDIPFLGEPVFTLVASSPLVVDHPGGATSANVLPMARAGFRRHVTRLGGGGEHAWITDGVARQLGVRPGGSVTTIPPLFAPRRGTAIRIGAVYRQLSTEPARPYWANFSKQIYPDPASDAPDPPAFMLMTQQQLRALLTRLGGGSMTAIWEYPVHQSDLTVREAKRLQERFAAIEDGVKRRSTPLARRLGCRDAMGLPFGTCVARSSLPSAIALAEHNIDAVSAPTRLLADIGAAVALAAFAAVGAFVVVRRRAEARLLFSRGESAVSFGARTALEGLLPTVAGGLAGFALALAFVRAAEPDGTIDAAAIRSAASRAAFAVAVGLVLFAATAAVSFLRQYEARSWQGARLARLPWELPLLGCGIYLLVDVLHGGGVAGRGSAGGPHPSLEVFLLPLLLLAASAGLAWRLVRPLLARADLRARIPAVPVYLAVRRLVTGRSVVVLLTTLCVVSLGLLFYAQALADSLDRSARTKAYVAVGSDVQGNVDGAAALPAAFPYPATKVEVSYAGAAVESVIGPQVDMLVVDPQTFAPAVHWASSWGPPPSRWLARLARPRNGRLPVVATRSFPPAKAIWISGERIPIEIVARVRTFPAMSTAPLAVAASKPLAEASARAGLGQYPFEGGFSFVWARGPASAVKRALLGSNMEVAFPVTVDDVLHSPDVTVATHTYSFLRSLGVAVGMLALVGVALYLYARQRRQAIAAAFSTRMGATRAAGVAAIWLELSSLLLFAALLAALVSMLAARPVVAHTDPLPQYPPAPTFAAPWSLIALTVVALVTFALAAAIVTAWLAQRRELGEELRLV